MLVEPPILTFAGGAVLGLASSVHCASMCGGVASALMFALAPAPGAAAQAQALVMTQAGRASGYILAGAVAASVGAPVIGALDHAGALLIGRWIAAATLVWIGLSTLGLAPPLSLLDRVLAPMLAGLRARIGAASAGRRFDVGAPFVAGLGWSLTPCGVMLGALVYASLAGSALGGAQVMAGFALGTLPAVIASAYGAGALKTLTRSPRMRVGAGAALVLLGVLSGLPGVGDAIFCRL